MYQRSWNALHHSFAYMAPLHRHSALTLGLMQSLNIRSQMGKQQRLEVYFRSNKNSPTLKQLARNTSFDDAAQEEAL